MSQNITIERPQPLGAFDYPAGLLLVSGEGTQPVRDSLLNGKIPEEWPAQAGGVRLAYAGDAEAARDWFAGRADTDPVAAYNLWVLDPEAKISRPADTDAPASPSETTREALVHWLGSEWAPLVDYVAYASGQTNVPPEPTGTTGELEALIDTAQAASVMDLGDDQRLADWLAKAAQASHGVHPAFEGIVLAELAGRARDLDTAEQSVALLKDTDLKLHYGEALYQRAGLWHGLAIEGRHPMSEAISGYTEALEFITETNNPDLFARIHLNLGTAYLAAPLGGHSDSIRAGVAVQSLRTAVRILDPKEDRYEWEAATLNLANALVYAPSAHQRDNMMEAVDLYETVLKDRPKNDRLGRARVLANQGTTLGHLGYHQDALNRLTEAKDLFEKAGDTNSAKLVSDAIAELGKITDDQG